MKYVVRTMENQCFRADQDATGRYRLSLCGYATATLFSKDEAERVAKYIQDNARTEYGEVHTSEAAGLLREELRRARLHVRMLQEQLEKSQEP